MRKSIITATLISAALLSAPLAAEDQKRAVVMEGSSEPLPTRVVRFADLNLRAPEGQAALHKRIKRAIASLCDVSMSTVALYQQMWHRKCTRHTAAAVAPRVAYVIERANLRGNTLAMGEALTISLAP